MRTILFRASLEGEHYREGVIEMRTYRVKELAKERGLTQVDLAIKSGVSVTLVQRLWQNRAPEGVRLKSLEAIARALDLPRIEDLYLDAGGAQPTTPGNKMSLAGAGA